MKMLLEHTFEEELAGLYVPWQPEGFPSPELMVLNEPLFAKLGLGREIAERAADVFSGSVVPEGARPIALAYAGHQFGGFSPSLGDGRALLLGELLNADGQRLDLHLKGSGPTPFSRGGDGKATVGPVLREYLLGEAMHHLGIPTTRVLAAIRTGEPVLRDKPLPGAVLARTAKSHLRVGTLQYLAARGDRAALERVVRYALKRHYPARPPSDMPALDLLQAVSEAQARLISQWMLVGFIHGVMNTDNMTLSGETIDYGPCAFMERYDPATAYSSIDHHGRYAFGNQPTIGGWNIARMAEALLGLIDPDERKAIEKAQGVLEGYLTHFETHYRAGLRAKLGLVEKSATREADDQLASDCLDWMHARKQDYTRSFRALAEGLRSAALPYQDDAFSAWHQRWQLRLGQEAPSEIAKRMDAKNPLYIPRNHRVEAALDAAIAGDLRPFHEMLCVLASPFDAQPGRDEYAESAPPDFFPYRTFCGT